ncbi:MAG: mechanosensitive ion channel family protein [Ignavibacteria bacterium]|nr:mechanosensitive ion channel family protein [Ignavibacteria bacterium]
MDFNRLREFIGDELLYHVVVAVILFLVVTAFGWIFKRFLNTIGRRLIAKTKSDLDDMIVDILVQNVKWFALVLAFYLSAEEITKAIPPENTMALKFLSYFNGIVFVVFVIVVTGIVIRIADSSVKYAIENHAKRINTRINEALLPLINRVLNIAIILIAVIIVLNHFGQDVSSLVVSLGVGSLAIALAAQDTLANMIAGFVIMMDRPFRVGDRIKLPSGEIGDVSEIGIRSTKILDFDNNVIVHPNAELIKSKIVNYSYPEEIIRVIVEVGVAYGTEIDKARYIMLDAARNHPNVLKDPIPEVFVIDLAESSVNLRLVARTDDFRKKFLTETMLREQIYNAFRADGVEIPFPQRVLYVREQRNGITQTRQKRKTVRR